MSNVSNPMHLDIILNANLSQVERLEVLSLRNCLLLHLMSFSQLNILESADLLDVLL
jgi:hypothetical protein